MRVGWAGGLWACLPQSAQGADDLFPFFCPPLPRYLVWHSVWEPAGEGGVGEAIPIKLGLVYESEINSMSTLDRTG